MILCLLGQTTNMHPNLLGQMNKMGNSPNQWICSFVWTNEQMNLCFVHLFTEIRTNGGNKSKWTKKHQMHGSRICYLLGQICVDKSILKRVARICHLFGQNLYGQITNEMICNLYGQNLYGQITNEIICYLYGQNLYEQITNGNRLLFVRTNLYGQIGGPAALDFLLFVWTKFVWTNNKWG